MHDVFLCDVICVLTVIVFTYLVMYVSDLDIMYTLSINIQYIHMISSIIYCSEIYIYIMYRSSIYPLVKLTVCYGKSSFLDG